MRQNEGTMERGGGGGGGEGIGEGGRHLGGGGGRREVLGWKGRGIDRQAYHECVRPFPPPSAVAVGRL